MRRQLATAVLAALAACGGEVPEDGASDTSGAMTQDTVVDNDEVVAVDEWVASVCAELAVEVGLQIRALQGFGVLERVHSIADLPEQGSPAEAEAIFAAIEAHRLLDEIYANAVRSAGIPDLGDADGATYRQELLDYLATGGEFVDELYEGFARDSILRDVFTEPTSGRRTYDDLSLAFSELPEPDEVEVGDAIADNGDCGEVDQSFASLGEYAFYTALQFLGGIAPPLNYDQVADIEGTGSSPSDPEE